MGNLSKGMEEKVAPEVERQLAIHSEAASKAEHERLEAIKGQYEVELEQAKAEIRSLQGANLVAGEKGFLKCREQVWCLYKYLDLKPLGFFKT